MKKLNICKNCENKFEVVGNYHTYCSNKCKVSAFNKKYRPKKIFSKINCAICKNSFTPISKRNLYCSDNCRKLAQSHSVTKERVVENQYQNTNKNKKHPLYNRVNYSLNEDSAIKILRKDGWNTSYIAEILGRTNTSVRSRLKYLNLGQFINPAKILFKKKDEISKTLNTINNNNKAKETLSNLIIYEKLIKNGFEIYKGREGSQIDILAYKNKKLFKIQLKSVGFYAKKNNFPVTCNNFFHFNSKEKKFDYFKYNDIDFFIFNCFGTEHNYIIPFAKIKNINVASSLIFYPHRMKSMEPNDSMKFDSYLNNFEIIK